MKTVYPTQQINRRSVIALGVIVLLGFIFFVLNAQMELATDDLFWLRGQSPTVFDQYRIIPRILFSMLRNVFGENLIAAYLMIFVTHLCNTIIIFLLAGQWLANQRTALVVVWVFAINPITLSALTWISCFSYIIGAWFALISLLIFWISLNDLGPPYFILLAGVSFFLGLFCTHEILFLPLIFIGLGWLKGPQAFRRGLWLGALTTILALLVNFSFYRFSRYGIQTDQLFSLDFIAVLITLPSIAFSMSLTYILSFFSQYLQVLKASFFEPIRWLVTLCLWSLFLFFYRPSSIRWRLGLVFFWIWLTLILPYVLRLYLMPRTIQYHISYILSGRVFYISFIGLALMLGLIAEIVYERFFHSIPYIWLWLILPGAAYLNLYSIYSAEDFRGLSVSTISFQPQLVIDSWNPFTNIHVVWLLVFVIVTVCLVIIRRRTSLRLSFRD